MDKAYFLELAGYHRWAYERLYEQVDRLTEGAQREDRGLFFRSVHGTLNHLLLVERLWHGRMIRKPYAVTGLDQEIEANPTALRDGIFRQCDVWDDYIAGLDGDALLENLDYTSTKGEAHSMPLRFLLAHVFNHATHHRGQISTALTQAGLAAPVMDIPYYLAEKSGGWLVRS